MYTFSWYQMSHPKKTLFSLLLFVTITMENMSYFKPGETHQIFPYDFFQMCYVS